MTFSWVGFKKRVIALNQKYYQTLSRNANITNPDWAAKHPDWTRDASLETPNYTVMNKAIKDEVEKNYKNKFDRSGKIWTK